MIKVSINLSFLETIKSSDFLTFGALVLAYLAYIKSINDKYESWKSLMISLKSDIESQSSWLFGKYERSQYKDKNSYSSSKIVYNLSFESLGEIIQRGVSDSNVLSPKMNLQISLFSERITAFNQLLDYQKSLITTNPIMSNRLDEKLLEFGLCNCAVSENEFIDKIETLKKDEKELYNLSMQIRRVNEAIHVGLIGDENTIDRLHYLSKIILNEINEKIDKYESIKPWFIRRKWIIVMLLASLIFFTMVENYLK